MGRKKSAVSSGIETTEMQSKAKVCKGRAKGSTKYQDGVLLDMIQGQMPTNKHGWLEVSVSKYCVCKFSEFCFGAGCL